MEAEAASLVRLQRRHLAGGTHAPPLADVVAAADELVDNLRLAPTNVARASAGPLPVGGRARRAPRAAHLLNAPAYCGTPRAVTLRSRNLSKHMITFPQLLTP